MNVCYTCNKAVPKEHDCVGKKMAENPRPISAPWVHSAAVPTRLGSDKGR